MEIQKHLDSLIKYSKVLRHHAALHDRAVSFKNCKAKIPGYAYAFHYLPLNRCLFGDLTGLLSTSFFQTIYPRSLRDLEC